MSDDATNGPDAGEIRAWITSTWPDTAIIEAMNATFFSLDDRHWPNFATIVTTDEHDTASNLSRPGVFRLNIGVGRPTFERLVGGATKPDYTALDTVLPHPVYAKQLWISILNPSHRSFDETIKPLLVEAHDRLAASKRERK